MNIIVVRDSGDGYRVMRKDDPKMIKDVSYGSTMEEALTKFYSKYLLITISRSVYEEAMGYSDITLGDLS